MFDGKIPAVVLNTLKMLAPNITEQIEALPGQIDEIGQIVRHYDVQLAEIKAQQAEILALLRPPGAHPPATQDATHGERTGRQNGQS